MYSLLHPTANASAGLCLPRREEEDVDWLASRRSLTLKNEILICVPVRVKSVSWKLLREGRPLKHPMNIKVGGGEERIKDWSELKLQGQFKRVREPAEWLLRTEKVGKRDGRAQLCSSDQAHFRRNFWYVANALPLSTRLASSVCSVKKGVRDFLSTGNPLLT